MHLLFSVHCFKKSYTQIKDATAGIRHADSIQTPAWGGNCMHWTVGHVVVARCNFLNLLDIASIWDWATCKLFIPGSAPTSESSNHINFSALRRDLDRTQELLIAALDHYSEVEMTVIKEDLTIGEHLASYATHEAYHAGQLEILRRGLGQ